MSYVEAIDMIGLKQRIFNEYHTTVGQHCSDNFVDELNKKAFTHSVLPEFQHNLNLIVDIIEKNIQNDKKTRHLCNRVVAFEAEVKNTKKVIEQHNQLINTVNFVINIIDNLMINNNDISFDEIVEVFRKLQDQYYKDYKTYELGELVSNLITSKLVSSMTMWNPLVKPMLYLDLIKQWKDILSIESNLIKTRTSTTLYEQLIWNAWMPPVRRAIEQWVCRQPDPLIEFFESWMPFISKSIMDELVMIVLQKLTSEVIEWNPKIDTVSIHMWIYPWLPLLGDNMNTEIYPIIRRKLGFALINWHPSDNLARLMLEPWFQVFTKGDMEVFLIKNILPKLEIVMLEFIINPYSQLLDNWNWVYDWVTLLPVHIMVGLLNKYFFPKWLHSLAFWLNHSPNYNQIIQWYMEWKKMLNEKLLMEPVIKNNFEKALDIMNLTVLNTQGLQSGSVEYVLHLINFERIQLTS